MMKCAYFIIVSVG